MDHPPGTQRAPRRSSRIRQRAAALPPIQKPPAPNPPPLPPPPQGQPQKSRSRKRKRKADEGEHPVPELPVPPQERQALTKAYLDKLCPVDEPPSTPSSCPSGMSSIPLGGGPSSPSGLRPARSSLKKPSLNCLDMQAFFGYQPYKYQAPIRKPSNLPEIEAALTRARTDGAQDWEAASLAFNAKTNTRHCEQQVSYHLDLFLKFRAEDGIHRSEAVVWKQLEGLLPGHKYIIPDFSCGLDGGHDELAIRGWIRAALPTFIQEDAITSVNCLMECKSILGGSIYAARIQNRAAAAIAALQWHRFEQHILKRTPPTGQASVGSICFDGNIIEASVHWLELADDESREFDVYSYKVAAGIASAVGGKQFEETQRVFRNFVDWFKEQRQKRFEAICTLPKRLEPQARILAKDLNRKLQPQPQPQPQPLPPSTTPDLSKGMTVDQPVDGDPPLTAGQPMSHLGVGEVVEEAAERVVEEAVDAVVDEIVDAAGLQTGKRPNEGEDNNRVEQKRQKTAE